MKISQWLLNLITLNPIALLFRIYIYPRRRWPRSCEYCRKSTGVSMYSWATEDICETCAKAIQLAYDEEI